MKSDQIFINLIIISIFLAFFDYFAFFSVIKKPLDPFVTGTKSYVFQKYKVGRLYYQSISRLPEFAGMQNDLEDYRKKLQDSQQKNSLLIFENNQLKSQLGITASGNLKLQLANIVGVSNNAEIDIGSDEGIKNNMTVILGNGYFGKIIKTTPSRSLVLLPTDPESSIPAKSSRGVKGIVKGQGYEKIIFDKVLQKEQLFLDDIILTTGEEGIPPNLLIGSINHINVDDVSPYKSAFVSPNINYKNTQMVFVVLAQ